MRHLITTALIGSGLLISSVAGQAQVYGRGAYDHNPVYGEFGRYTDSRDTGRSLLDSVRRDLDQVEASSNRFGDGRDHRRFNKVREELGEFQNNLNRGRFDRRQLNDVIKSLQRVVNDRNLDYRDSDVLRADMFQLRDFLARN